MFQHEFLQKNVFIHDYTRKIKQFYGVQSELNRRC